ncbi:HdeD family acid-resistance protein [Gulosibacter molinativorax]|uniref:Acyl-CoA synthetase n=1 Tax=Gulosibacter molinativorax TaxID=256821 RepID=A0ABT7C9A8_9MICO|nr:DUF308 domain-containing protein [Gulosibacter molinativorax]MDJ1371732.1 hypothetical protein [Gulosibacter molinativorax]QUY63154.1 Hypotetical protein [Gulosibacter molinativorax]
MNTTKTGVASADVDQYLPESLWKSMLFRAVPAIIGAIVITFTQEHTARFGFIVFGAVALWTGIIVGFEAVGIKGHPLRGFVFARSILGAIAGGFSLFMGTGGHNWATVEAFIWTVATWAIVTGAIELIAGLVFRKQSIYRSEIVFSGAITMLLGIIVAFVPPELDAEYGGLENIEGSLTADVQAVGFVGAYFAVLGVLLIIEAITLRSEMRRRDEQQTADTTVSKES